MVVRILFSRKFHKNFEKRILRDQKLSNRFDKRIKQFSNNSNHPLLRDHPLTGSKKHLRSFSITGDIRVLYQPLNNNAVILIDIGSHNQVY
jgi:addiction module RelE/StbE family toxin